jgi:hypothetical protein
VAPSKKRPQSLKLVQIACREALEIEIGPTLMCVVPFSMLKAEGFGLFLGQEFHSTRIPKLHGNPVWTS